MGSSRVSSLTRCVLSSSSRLIASLIAPPVAWSWRVLRDRTADCDSVWFVDIANRVPSDADDKGVSASSAILTERLRVDVEVLAAGSSNVDSFVVVCGDEIDCGCDCAEDSESDLDTVFVSGRDCFEGERGGGCEVAD